MGEGKITDITIAEALEMIRNTSKFEHSLRVAKHMASLANYFGKDSYEWELVGLLHDLDYDETMNQRELHGVLAGERLRGFFIISCFLLKALSTIISNDLPFHGHLHKC